MKIIFCLAAAGIVSAWYLLHRAMSDSHNDNQEIRITASALGREISGSYSSAFQSRYYLRRINITGTVTSSEILSAPDKCRHHVILDNVIRCEFAQVQDNIHDGEKIEISGLCLGKILTGCSVI